MKTKETNEEASHSNPDSSKVLKFCNNEKMAYSPVFEPPPMVVEPDTLRHASHDVHHVLLVHRHLEAVAG